MAAARNMILRNTMVTVMFSVVLLSASSEARPVNFHNTPALCLGMCAADVFTCMTSCALRGAEASPCALKCNTVNGDCIAKCPGSTPPAPAPAPAPAAPVPAPAVPVSLDAPVSPKF